MATGTYQRWVFPLMGAAGAGVLVGGFIWAYARSSLDQRFDQGAEALAQELGQSRQEFRTQLRQGRQQLESQIQAEVSSQVPTAVRQGVTRALRDHGLTPTRLGQIYAVLDWADDQGLI